MPSATMPGPDNRAVPCNLCGSGNQAALHGNLRRITGYSMARCRACGLVFQSPRPPAELDTEYYRSSYYEAAHKSNEHVSRIPMFRAYLARIERLCVKGAILDIGCGPAHFLRFARERGFDVCGVEVSRSAVAEASVHLPGKVILGTVADAELPRGHFDVVTMFNVLDQLPDPFGTVRKVHRLLKPGGFVLARVPNGVFHRPFKAVLNDLDGLTEKYDLHDLTPFHLYQFTPGTLRALYRRAGFECIRVKSSHVSKGDPSGRRRGAALCALVVAKHGLGLAARLVCGATRGRLNVGTSLDGYAFKER